MNVEMRGRIGYKPGVTVRFTPCFLNQDVPAIMMDWEDLGPLPAVPFTEEVLGYLKSGECTVVLLDNCDNSKWTYTPYYVVPTCFLELV